MSSTLKLNSEPPLDPGSSGMAPFDPGARTVSAIARRLEVTRGALGLTQAELCKRAGIQPNTYNQYEKGHGRPELDKAILICDEFGLTLDWIYRGEASGLPHGLASKISIALRQTPNEESAPRSPRRRALR